MVALSYYAGNQTSDRLPSHPKQRWCMEPQTAVLCLLMILIYVSCACLALTQHPCSLPLSSLSMPGGQAVAHPTVCTGWWSHTGASPTPPPAAADVAFQPTYAPAGHAQPHPSHLQPSPVLGSYLLWLAYCGRNLRRSEWLNFNYTGLSVPSVLTDLCSTGQTSS